MPSCLIATCSCGASTAIPNVPHRWQYYRIQKLYRCSSRELKRLDSISKSPIFAHFSESLSGLSTLRACVVACVGVTHDTVHNT